MGGEGADKVLIMLPVAIEPMRIEDLDAVLEIERASFPTPWTKGMFLVELKDKDFSYFLVAKVGGRVVGYSGFWLVADEAHITNLAVHPSYRREKVGEQLIVAILDLARAKGAIKTTLEVRISNLPAQRLYEKFGFRGIALRKGYYSDVGEDALIMLIADLWSAEFEGKLKQIKKNLSYLSGKPF